MFIFCGKLQIIAKMYMGRKMTLPGDRMPFSPACISGRPKEQQA
jgi:hypothetical protein